MGRDYRKIKAWQMSDDLAFQIFFVTSHFPNYEKFGLALQMRRAALSVPANIVEGSTRMTRKDFEKLAAAISKIKDLEERREVAKLIVDMCRKDNPRFDEDRFFRACGLFK